MRVFLDSNVVFSGLYSASGAPATILDHLAGGRLRVVISQQTIRETVSALKEAKPEAVPALMNFLSNSKLEIVRQPPIDEIRTWRKLIHEEDAAILVAAMDATPDYFITGDKDFLNSPEIGRKSGLHIITPAGFLAVFKPE